jgi:hypothetical protein
MFGVVPDVVFGKGDVNEVCPKIVERGPLLGEDSVTEMILRGFIAMKNLADGRRIDEKQLVVVTVISEKLPTIDKNSAEDLKPFTLTFPDVGHRQ